ncbi:hypothetical protein AB3S75_005744 [Citrus x aurantiifolia]
MTALTKYHAYMMAFRTAFRTLQRLKNYKGITFLRTFSPSHFENGDWDKGGNCGRTRPFTSQEVELDGYTMEFYLTQVEELRAAENQGMDMGLKFSLLDSTEIMLLRPDGHPNQYRHSMHKNKTVNDCVHWCLPGPIDTWNEFLFYMLKIERQRAVVENRNHFTVIVYLHIQSPDSLLTSQILFYTQITIGSNNFMRPEL